MLKWYHSLILNTRLNSQMTLKLTIRPMALREKKFHTGPALLGPVWKYCCQALVTKNDTVYSVIR